MSLDKILEKYRLTSTSEKDKGDKFERLIQAFFKSDSLYRDDFVSVDLWKDFKYKQQFGDIDLGIDLVGYTKDGKYWAIQCKFYADDAKLSSHNVQGLLSEGGKQFKDESGNLVQFSVNCLVSTAYMGINAQKKTWNRAIEFIDIHRAKLEKSDVDWEVLDQGIYGKDAQLPKKNLRPHQTEALTNTNIHFQSNDRGKLIMACGTGKTFTALRIAEKETNNKGTVLFLVPSIALLGQTLREWKSDTVTHIHAICICSDPEISKKIGRNEEMDTDRIDELAYPASTDVEQVLQQFENIKNRSEEGMTVVFSTYQSIDVISKSQQKLMENGFPEFDLIICDEAHRTTGVTIAGKDESSFTKVHNNDFLKSKKRLYMTATPRLYNDDSKSKAAQADAILCSMDDESLYGQEMYRIGFGQAVEQNLLTDYKVLILTLSDSDIPPSIQKLIADGDSEINTDDAAKLIGCINALSKEVLGDDGLLTETDPGPMKRAVAFCSNIKSSKKITEIFNAVSKNYIESLPEEKRGNMVSLSSDHIDGTMSAPDKDRLLGWLKKEKKDKECSILTNVRVLSEGVDVPSLDAVLFLSARNSQVDVVQSVGRVMRKASGKKYGYIIIPVVVPSNVDADKAMDDNDRFKVVWSVLNALRAHDDQFNAIVNKIDLNNKKTGKIIVGRAPVQFGMDGKPISTKGDDEYASLSQQMTLQFEELQSVVFARMVQKVGERRYWEQWAKDVAQIAEMQMDRIKRLIKDEGKYQKTFEQFVFGLRQNINPSITEVEAIDLLSQHMITKPVFDALFEGYSFVKNNPISKSMQTMLDLMEDQALEKDTETLTKFYESVKMRASGIDNAEGKQKIIIELYDKFFKTAFPKMVEKLGIVYTPVECVDFILYSVNDVLKKEFGKGLTDEHVHLLDPFTGTGTFITRLIQSGLIELKDLERKYKHEIHANEIVLLAYYIATINIENAFHDATPEDDGIGTGTYTQFDGIVLTDTFQLGESEADEKLFSEMFPQNSDRVEKQRNAPLRVIFGNPPYSIGQKSENDNAQNQSYPKLDNRISETYAKLTDATNKNALYDSYIKAFRWCTDRLDKESGGILSFITNGTWLDGNSQDGFRKSLEKEFTSIYVFNLRGNQRTSGELSRKEGGKIFGSGSRTPIAITLLVKNPDVKTDRATIYYHDIGDYLSQSEKLNIVREFGSVANELIDWRVLTPNEHGDWISMRNESFDEFIPIEPDVKFNTKSNSFFTLTSNGVGSSRDAWVYNFSQHKLEKNVKSTIEFYNRQVDLLQESKKTNEHINIKEFISNDSTKISWSSSLIPNLERGRKDTYVMKSNRIAVYRPFHKSHLYFGDKLIHRKGNFESSNPIGKKNLIICVSGKGNSNLHCLFISDTIIDYNALDAGARCFPLYYFEENKEVQQGLFETESNEEYIRRDGVSDYILDKATKQYNATNITKEDIFFYVYGFLHSPEYRETFANDLKKMLPRLPLVEDVKDFWSFSKAGRELSELHLNYESVPPYEDVKVIGEESNFFKVEKMRFPKKDQKETIHYNSSITISNIPLEAYEYVVNGKSAIEWIMERYQITTHKESQITNDPNDWADEVGNPRYILDLLLSIINVSMQTREIVGRLPKIEFE